MVDLDQHEAVRHLGEAPRKAGRRCSTTPTSWTWIATASSKSLTRPNLRVTGQTTRRSPSNPRKYAVYKIAGEDGYKPSGLVFEFFREFLAGPAKLQGDGFVASQPGAPYVMTIVTGDGRNVLPVTSAEVRLNGELVAGPEKINQNNRLLKVPVIVRAENVVEVTFSGPEGSALFIGVAPVRSESANRSSRPPLPGTRCWAGHAHATNKAVDPIPRLALSCVLRISCKDRFVSRWPIIFPRSSACDKTKSAPSTTGRISPASATRSAPCGAPSLPRTPRRPPSCCPRLSRSSTAPPRAASSRRTPRRGINPSCTCV